MNTVNKGIKNTIFGVLAQLVTVAVGLFLPRLILLHFGSEVNGLLNSSTQIFNYFTLFEAGVSTAALQALFAPVANGEKDEINGIMAATSRFLTRTGFIYGGAVIALAFLYPLIVKTELNYWLVVGVICFGGLGNALGFIYQAKYKVLMQAEGLSFVSTNFQTAVYILTNILKIVFIYMGCSVIVVQACVFSVSLLQMAMYYCYVKKHYSWINLNVKPNTAAISKKNAALVHQITYMVFCNTDVLLLTVLLQDLKLVSVYTLYNLIITTVATFVGKLTSGFDFRMGQVYQLDKEKYRKLHHLYEIVYMGLLFTAMTTFYLMVLPFMNLYTAGITDVSYINKLYPFFFVMIQLLSGGRIAEANTITYAGHFEETKWRAVAETVINIGVSVFCILKFGIIGALMGTIAALLYRTTDIIFYCYKRLLHESPWKTYKRWLVCFGIFFAFIKFVNLMPAGIDNYLLWVERAIIIGVGCLAAYVIGLTASNVKEIKEALGLVKEVLKK